MNTFERGSFDHIGIPSDEPRPGEVYVPETKVWVTSPRDNPANVEWVRFEDDSPVTGPLRHMPHLAPTARWTSRRRSRATTSSWNRSWSPTGF